MTIFLHEFYHFLTDAGATVLELSSPTIPRPQIYVPYNKNVYLMSYGAHEPLEEALANAFSLRHFSGEERRVLRGFMSQQLNGYRDFASYLSGPKFREGKRHLATQLSTGHKGVQGIPPLEMLIDTYRNDVFHHLVPVYIVDHSFGMTPMIRFVEAIPATALVKSKKFTKELAGLPTKIAALVMKALEALSDDVRRIGLSFEKLKGKRLVFTIRVNDDYRISLRPMDGGRWELLRVARHAEIYRNPA